MAQYKSASAFTQAASRRVVRVVRQIERGSRDIHAAPLRTATDDDPGIRLAKTTTPWNKGTLADVEVYDQGTPPNEQKDTPPEVLEDCVNKFANVASGKWVMVSRLPNGRWYLIAAEC